MFSCKTYQIQEDEFRGNKTVRLTQESYAQEQSELEKLCTANIEYQRIIEKNDEKFRIYFVLNSSANSFDLEETGFLKAGNETFEFELSNLNSVYRSSTSSKTRTSTAKDSTQTVTTSSAETKTYEWKSNKFIIETTPEMINAIKKAKEIQFRFYLGAQTATFILTKRQSKRLVAIFEK
jgi:hypothetical protein